MTERLADVSARIDGIRQLGAVVNAMKGIAAARANTARTEIEAVDSYAATIATAISDALGPASPAPSDGHVNGGTGLLVFCAEQGFAGAFSERVLDSIEDDLPTTSLFLIGTRGLSIAAARGLDPVWSAPMSSHTPGIPKLADHITKAIYRALGEGRFERMDMIHAGWASGQPQVVRQVLLPIDLSALPPPGATRPLTQLPTDALINSLSGDYLHALVCKATLHAFAAENEARMEAMSAAGSQITRELGEFEATLRRVRQEAITAEIIELGTGTASIPGARTRNLAKLPEGTARQRLEALMTRFYDVSTPVPEQIRIVSGLLALLPRRATTARSTEDGTSPNLVLLPQGSAFYWIIAAALFVGRIAILAQGQ